MSVNKAHNKTREDLEKIITGFKQVMGAVQEGIRIVSNVLNGYINRLDKKKIKKMHRYYKHLKRVANRQKLHEKRKRIGRI